MTSSTKGLLLVLLALVLWPAASKDVVEVKEGRIFPRLASCFFKTRLNALRHHLDIVQGHAVRDLSQTISTRDLPQVSANVAASSLQPLEALSKGQDEHIKLSKAGIESLMQKVLNVKQSLRSRQPREEYIRLEEPLWQGKTMTTGKELQFRRLLGFHQVAFSWSADRQIPPCPVWSPTLANSACMNGLNVAGPSEQCLQNQPLPALLRASGDVAFDSMRPNSSFIMRCFDNLGYFDPPADAECSLATFRRSDEDSSTCSSCSPDYYGMQCSLCPSCGSHGTCNDTLSGNGQCVCDSGWSGASCSICASGYYGSSCLACPSCGSHGTCSDTLSGNGQCVCDSGWSGASCSICASGYYGSSCLACPSCGSHGTCSDTLSGNGQCVCDSGWSGTLCDEADSQIDCATAPEGTQYCVEIGVSPSYVTCNFGNEVVQSCGGGTKCYDNGSGVFCNY